MGSFVKVSMKTMTTMKSAMMVTTTMTTTASKAVGIPVVVMASWGLVNPVMTAMMSPMTSVMIADPTRAAMAKSRAPKPVMMATKTMGMIV
jgi:hypothetical protein